MTTSNFFILAEPPQSAQARTKDPPCVETKKSSFTQLNAKAEPETRLWKICSEIAPQRLSAIEWIALLFFAVSASLSLGFCVFEWFRLSNSGALEQIVRAIPTR